jgi:hypothetical protein
LKELQERISDSTRRSPLFDALARVRDTEAACRGMAARARNGLRPEFFEVPAGSS